MIGKWRYKYEQACYDCLKINEIILDKPMEIRGYEEVVCDCGKIVFIRSRYLKVVK